mmetsp:Transcript_44258/g.134141  ORF Transcript_44258/g.134141 Transcript_44258/m.134141 type:complete len:228 (-) Transcript_44258:120-803(-)
MTPMHTEELCTSASAFAGDCPGVPSSGMPRKRTVPKRTSAMEDRFLGTGMPSMDIVRPMSVRPPSETARLRTGALVMVVFPDSGPHDTARAMSLNSLFSASSTAAAGVSVGSASSASASEMEAWEAKLKEVAMPTMPRIRTPSASSVRGQLPTSLSWSTQKPQKNDAKMLAPATMAWPHARPMCRTATTVIVPDGTQAHPLARPHHENSKGTATKSSKVSEQTESVL